MATIGGVDEAGRGAVIGPLVIAGVSIEEKDEDKLRKIGVKDSKLLSPKRREELAAKIEGIAKDVMVLNVGPCKIDNYRNQGINLNRVESMKFAEVLSFLDPNRAYIDSPDVNTNRLKMQMQKMVGDDMELVVEHKADMNYPVVAAASIMAKVARDDEIKEIKKKYGDVGPGYSSNQITMKWMREWLDKNNDFPEGIVRKTWMTTKNVNGEKAQKKIGMFFKSLVKKE
ncbi:MAG: ribonuclease HII [Candidatus Aenigmatarchaeota archaeon]|nr:MAG: ribonuclease HII [Candidatus Aenigmarchaeota archaeon]